MSNRIDAFNAKDKITTPLGEANIYRLEALKEAGIGHIDRLPFSIKVLLENALRNLDNREVTEDDIHTLANWSDDNEDVTIPFKPARVILQDFTGVPSVVDLAALRSAMDRAGGDPQKINPVCPVDLVIDHSVQVDAFGSSAALLINSQYEFERNRERYEFLHWGQKAFDGFKVVPPATGIVHQVNLEYLAKVVQFYDDPDAPGEKIALPDSLVGTDSHTTMINGLGVVGWGVGGIEAEAAMLGQPIYMQMPEVVGFKLTGELHEGATATDLVLVVTEMLREKGVVGKFVEFYGAGLSNMTLPDRATIANMAPEYGATMGFFPVDEEVCNYLIRTGRDQELADFVRLYAQEQGIYRTDSTPDPLFTDTLELDMGTVPPSVAGPQRPQDRVELNRVKERFNDVLGAEPNAVGGFQVTGEAVNTRVPLQMKEQQGELTHGDVVIAAITSCTNTSNPSVMVAAGLLAQKAIDKGLQTKPFVKTSLAPGSKVVTEYLTKADLMPALEQLGFNVVGYGCTTCIGNSGPLPEEVTQAITEGDLVVSSVLSGNRNFAGRIGPDIKTNFLASPPLVVAFALAGTVSINFDTEPIGQDADGNDVYLKDIWPSPEEVKQLIQDNISPEIYNNQYGEVYTGNETWNEIPSSDSPVFGWEEDSTYIKEPPFWQGMSADVPPVEPVKDAHVLVLAGDSITTDHISPAGIIGKDSPAGRYLIENGIERKNFNSYGSRRGNHEVMMRGTFANVRLRNQLIPGSEGGVTLHVPSGDEMSVYDAAMRYIDEGRDLVVLGGEDYGMGSSRDWAAKGTQLLGVKAVVAKSYERIHRSNLVMMGVLPLQFADGEGWEELGLTGHETFDISDLNDDLQPGQTLKMTATAIDGTQTEFETIVRLDGDVEVDYYKHGGILHYVLRNLM